MDYQKKYLKYKNKYITLLKQLGSGIEDLKNQLQNNSIGVGIYALAAPNDCASSLMKITHFNNIQKIVTECNPDGLIVYDIQDEKCKDGSERPFKFVKKEQADIFANFISKKLPKQPIILYRAIPKNSTSQNIDKWLDDSINKRNSKIIVWIGGGSRDGNINGLKPIDYVVNKVDISHKDVIYGGVCLPERYTLYNLQEHELLVDRIKHNYKFFVTQIVYNYDLFISLLNKYVDSCKTNSINPVRIIFTFALFSSDKTLDFMKCLGVIFDDSIKTDIEKIKSEITDDMSRDDIENKYVDYSIDKTCELFTKLLNFRKEKLSEGINIPIGFSTDVVTGSKIEFDKSILLYNKLNKIMIDNY